MQRSPGSSGFPGKINTYSMGFLNVLFVLLLIVNSTMVHTALLQPSMLEMIKHFDKHGQSLCLVLPVM